MCVGIVEKSAKGGKRVFREVYRELSKSIYSCRR
jgi:hypothetical protein